MRNALVEALFAPLAFAAVGFACGDALAAPTAHTSSIGFLAALPGTATRAGFDGLASGTVIPSTSSADGLVFDYDFGGVALIATPGALDGDGNAFTTTSAPHGLGTTDLDVLQDGDDLDLRFPSSNAVGLFIVTAEKPGVTLFDGDIRVSAGGAVAALDVDAVQSTLADGSRVYFLGVVDPVGRFDAASVGTFGAGGEFAFNIDDVVTAVPEPGAVSGIPSCLLALAAFPRRRRRANEAKR